MSARITSRSSARDRRLVPQSNLSAVAILIVLAAACLLVTPVPVFAQGYHVKIIETGDPLPGTTGVALDFENLKANRNGQVSFFDGLSSNPADIAVYVSQPGSTQEIARIGEPVLNGLGQLQQIFGSSSFSQSGQFGFAARGSGVGLGTRNTFLFLSNGNGGLTRVAREGDPAGSSGQFNSFGNATRPVVNASGDMYFVGFLTGAAGGVTQGLYRGNGTTTTELVRQGNSAVGNGTFSTFGLITANDQNQIAFFSSLTGTTGGAANDRGIFRTDGTSLVQIVRQGQTAPDGNGIFSDIDSFPQINQSGQIVFTSRMSGTVGNPGDNFGIFRGQGGAITQIARGGTAAPDGNGTIVGFSIGSSLNDNGKVLYRAVLMNTSGGDADNSALYLADGTSTVKIVREGQRVPGRGFFTTLSTGDVNNQDTVLFASDVSFFPGGSPDFRGIFLSDGSQIIEAMRTGDALGNSTIADVGQIGSSFDDDGQFTYRANLANGKTLIGQFTPDLHYRSTTSGNWDDRSNWTVGIRPNDVHDVFIASASDVTVTGPASDTTLRSLTIGGGAGQSTLFLPGGNGGIRVLDQALVAQNGVLAGSGRIDSEIVVDGTLSPGNSAGRITIRGSLDLNSTARFEVELGGLSPIEFDQVNVLGNVKLDGILEVELINGFSLSDGDEFRIIQSNRTITGQFLDLPDGSLVGRFGNQDLFITYNAIGGDVTLFSRLSSVPEPGTLSGLVLMAGLVLVNRRKRDCRI